MINKNEIALKLVKIYSKKLKDPLSKEEILDAFKYFRDNITPEFYITEDVNIVTDEISKI